MGKRYAMREKENKSLSPEERRYRQELVLLQKVRTRMHQSEVNMAKLSDSFRYLKRCVVNCVDIVNKSIDLMEHEREETKEVLDEMMEDEMQGRREETPGRDEVNPQRSVNPMVGGHTLKRAKISLKRLAPGRQLHGHREESPALPDSEDSADEYLNEDEDLDLNDEEPLSDDENTPQDNSLSGNSAEL